MREAAREIELLLKVGRFDMDNGAGMTMIHTYIIVQEIDLGGEGL